MSDEKRQTRLLPFRLRRAAQAHAADYTSEARDVSAGAEEFSEDSELSGLLRVWDAPEPSAGARERLLAEFRATVVRAPLWRRALSAELRVPLPVAACATLALLAAFFVLASRTQTPAQSALTQSTNADVRTNDAPAVKIVELPIERERVVTRIVYVEKNSARARARQLSARQSTSTRQHETMQREAITQSNSNREARAVRAAFDSGSRPADEPTSYFTRVDMADFQPADEMKIRIVKRGKADEK